MDPSSEGVERRLTAILSADVVGYSRLMAADDEATLRTLRACRDELTRLVAEHRGRVVDSPGDNLLAELPSALDATRCAVEAQRVLRERNADAPSERRMDWRIGVHLGDVMVEGERIYGDGVNIAARLESLAEAGGICISGTVHEQVRHRLDLGYQDLGEQPIKNLPHPIRIYRIQADGQVAMVARARSRRLIAGALVAAGSVAVALVAWRLLPTPGGPARGVAGPILSVAVLPLDNLSGDPEQEYFTDGMTEALIAQLGRLSGVRVISRTSVMRYKGATEALPAIAKALNVDAILEGSVLKAGERVRITAQLIDARSDDHLWAKSYERDLRDILSLQREVAEAVSGEVGLRVGDRPQRRSPRRDPVNPDAHEAYLKGLYFGWKMKPEPKAKQVAYYEEAIRADPSYALPYAGLADAYSCTPTHAWYMPESEGWPSVPQELMARAKLNAEKALELDDSLAEAHNSLGLVRLFGDWDWAGAEASFQRAIEIDPSYWWAHVAYALLLSFTGRLDEALAEMQRAYEFDPLNTIVIVQLAELHAWRGDHEQARSWWEKALELDPAYPLHHQSLVTSLCRHGQTDEAIASLEQAVAAAPDDPLIAADLGYCYGVSGRHEEASEILHRLEKISERTYVSPMDRAMIQVGLDDTDAAIEALERAYEDRAFFLPYLGLDGPYEALRSDPRFTDLLERIGLPAA